MADVPEDAHVEEKTYSIRADQDEAIEDELEYGDSKSEFVRGAIDLRLHLENDEELIADIRGEPTDPDEQSSADAVDNEAD